MDKDMRALLEAMSHAGHNINNPLQIIQGNCINTILKIQNTDTDLTREEVIALCKLIEEQIFKASDAIVSMRRVKNSIEKKHKIGRAA
jgi:hypothetical protein